MRQRFSTQAHCLASSHIEMEKAHASNDVLNASNDIGGEEIQGTQPTGVPIVKEAWFRTWLLVSISCWLIGVWSLRLLNPKWWIFTTKTQATDVYPHHMPEFYVHMIFGITAILVGPFQFLKSLRRRGWHVVLGRVYMIAVMCSGVAAFIFAFNAYGGVAGQVGFALLAVWWLVTAVMGYHSIKSKRVQEHRRWMIRNFALTVSSVTIRLYLVVPITYNGIMTKGKFVDAYPWQYAICVWLCWLPNVIVTELLFRHEKRTVSQSPATQD